ncbi:MAG: hypothetical protein DHS20C17_29940 [Cyclobacteriaceae bacterium]|nr:MAG: hypothetical protein DHS20C17_29940 [Cyclobacteriaceae bacterium]
MAMAASASLYSYAQQINQNFSGIEEIEISTGSSDCVLKKGSGTDVNVKLQHTRGENFKPTVRQSGSKLMISEDNQGNNRGEATWTLSIPDGLEVSLNTGSGDFEAADLEVELSLNAGSGDFELENLKGAVETNAGSGDLEIDTFAGRLHSNVGSGDLEVANVTGDIKLNAGSGDMELSNIHAQIDANVGSGDIEANKIIVSGKSQFNSGSGDVEIVLGESLKHDITVNSGSGDASLDFNGNEIDGMVTMTANKHNGDIEAPFAFDKEEEINNGDHTTIKKTARLGTGSVKIKVGTGSGTASIGN